MQNFYESESSGHSFGENWIFEQLLWGVIGGDHEYIMLQGDC